MSPSSNSESRRPGAYSVSTEPQGNPEMFQLKIPPNTTPGASFSFAIGNRRGLRARCPPSCKPGDLVRIAVQPQGQTQYKLLKVASLTATDTNWPPKDGNGATGGAHKMSSQTLKANQELLAADATSFLVSVPPNVYPGQQFVARTPHGQQYLVTCPPKAKSGQQIRMMIPPQNQNDEEEGDETEMMSGNGQQPHGVSCHGNHKIFEVIAPEGAQPNQVLPVLVCGKRIPITLPEQVTPGQKLKLKVPVQDVLGSIELSYDEKSSAGWYRTIRISDQKFQWVRIDDDPESAMSSSSRNFNIQQQEWNQYKKTIAFVRKLTTLQGNDPKMPTGHIELVKPSEMNVESELIHDQRTLVSYAAVAHIQQQPLDEKLNWFHNIWYVLKKRKISKKNPGENFFVQSIEEGGTQLYKELKELFSLFFSLSLYF